MRWVVATNVTAYWLIEEETSATSEQENLAVVGPYRSEARFQHRFGQRNGVL